ncbi:putative mini-chromosome maintenance complex-binding protein [Medicago truncatula]|uniref:Mini-chromosome maintenance complex-binding protein n=1 Tax=Medicago truncatula TaxID=3880 RepID=A0A072V141_MEDTR|nr:mini-chromosome maintenance complex-binding protein [Medicago truncatula]KEH35552.1 mini-chromosome maintenance complex-binding protein [Medicago truncatula]RHN69811.1 putative mini-chromosome maintenance complex-binding protein [Medicago truncatula]
MVGPQYDLLANPLGAVRSTFDAAIATGSDPTSLNNRDWGVIDLFRNLLSDQSHLSQVPLLTPATVRYVKPYTLVRFRGMIQDMLGNEFYVGAFKDGSVWRTNKFTDFCQHSIPVGCSADTPIWERRLLYCVPVPGLNSWAEPSAEAVGNPSMDWTSEQREKRRRGDEESPSNMPVEGDEVEGSPNTKRMREGECTSPASQSHGAVPEIAGSSMSLLPGLNGNSSSCIVKVYDTPESELKLNDIFEFVGILTSDPELQEDNEDSDLSNGFGEDPLHHFPADKVPRLHCFIHRKLSVQDFLQNKPIIEPKPDLVKGIRESLLRHLSAVLGNDEVAAHFMLLHLLSKVEARVDALAVGKFSVNFTCFSKETASIGKQLNHAVKNLVPFTHCMPLTVQYLNTASLAPKKNYDTNRLETGVLQLAEGSHLIVDETQLKAGTLNSVGVENARLLKNVMELQKVEYDFKYYKMEMATDVQLLVLSEGKSNILPADVIVPIRPSATICLEAVAAEALEAWRWYLATVRQLPHSFESETQQVVESDLVAAIQADRSLNTQDLSRLVTMGRLMCLSFGETTLSLEHWQMTKELERLRRERLN